jgi:predicted methyltransferase
MSTFIEVDAELASKFVAEELKYAIECFERDIRANESGEGYLPVFETDPKEDLKAMKKMLKALKRVRTYYTVPGEE